MSATHPLSLFAIRWPDGFHAEATLTNGWRVGLTPAGAARLLVALTGRADAMVHTRRAVYFLRPNHYGAWLLENGIGPAG